MLLLLLLLFLEAGDGITDGVAEISTALAGDASDDDFALGGFNRRRSFTLGLFSLMVCLRGFYSGSCSFTVSVSV